MQKPLLFHHLHTKRFSGNYTRMNNAVLAQAALRTSPEGYFGTTWHFLETQHLFLLLPPRSDIPLMLKFPYSLMAFNVQEI